MIGVSAIEVTLEELRDGVVTKLELQSVINLYKRYSFKSLQRMMEEFIMKKQIVVVVKKMVEWEAEEDSRCKSVDSFL